MASVSIVFGIYEKPLACLPLREPPNTFQGSPNFKSETQGWCGVYSALVVLEASSLQCARPALPTRQRCPCFWLAVGSQPW